MIKAEGLEVEFYNVLASLERHFGQWGLAGVVEVKMRLLMKWSAS